MSQSHYKIVIVGSGGVGKSAITVQFIQGNFVETYDPTIEDSYRKQIEVEGKACYLDILDTAGQEEFSALRDSYMRSGEGFVLVYSITAQNTLDEVEKIRDNIVRVKDDENIPMILVGNKCDLEDQRAVEESVGQAMAKKFKCTSLESSAKTNTKIDDIFNTLVKSIDVYREKSTDTNKPKKSKKCALL